MSVPLQPSITDDLRNRMILQVISECIAITRAIPRARTPASASGSRGMPRPSQYFVPRSTGSHIC
jgi:hypothetical protein